MCTEMVMGWAKPGAGRRYSAKNMSKPVDFYCVAPAAQTVCVVGDFNGWKAGVNPMDRQADGTWRASLSLTHGHHHYRFLVDGRPTLDPRATGVAVNGESERVSLKAVS